MDSRFQISIEWQVEALDHRPNVQDHRHRDYFVPTAPLPAVLSVNELEDHATQVKLPLWEIESGLPRTDRRLSESSR